MIEINNKIGKRYYSALVKKYEAEMEEAIANLELYMNNLAGIGEHSDLMEEHDKWIAKYTDAKDKLASVKELFTMCV